MLHKILSIRLILNKIVFIILSILISFVHSITKIFYPTIAGDPPYLQFIPIDNKSLIINITRNSQQLFVGVFIHWHKVVNGQNVGSWYQAISQLPHQTSINFYPTNYYVLFTILHNSQLYQKGLKAQFITYNNDNNKDDPIIKLYDLIPKTNQPVVLGQISSTRNKTLIQVLSQDCKSQNQNGYYIKLRQKQTGEYIIPKNNQPYILCFNDIAEPSLNYYQIQEQGRNFEIIVVPKSSLPGSYVLFYSKITVISQKNCFGVQYSSQKSQNQKNCFCNAKFLWKEGVHKCQRQCHKYGDQYGGNSGLIPYSYDICNCWYGKWDNVLQRCQCRPNEFLFYNEDTHLCQRDCTLIQGTLFKLKQNSKTQCACPQGYFWNQSKLQCQINCLKIYQTQGLVLKSNQLCVCKYGGQFNLETLSCPLPKNYYFNTNQNSFYINCSLIQRTKESTQQNTKKDQCQCINNLVWNSINQTCACKQKFYFNSNNNYCLKNCSFVPHANNTQKAKIQNDKNNNNKSNENQQSCICQKKYYWSNETLSCQSRCVFLQGYLKNQQNFKDKKYGKLRLQGKLDCEISYNESIALILSLPWGIIILVFFVIAVISMYRWHQKKKKVQRDKKLDTRFAGKDDMNSCRQVDQSGPGTMKRQAHNQAETIIIQQQIIED